MKDESEKELELLQNILRQGLTHPEKNVKQVIQDLFTKEVNEYEHG